MSSYLRQPLKLNRTPKWITAVLKGLIVIRETGIALVNNREDTNTVARMNIYIYKWHVGMKTLASCSGVRIEKWFTSTWWTFPAHSPVPNDSEPHPFWDGGKALYLTQTRGCFPRKRGICVNITIFAMVYICSHLQWDDFGRISAAIVANKPNLPYATADAPPWCQDLIYLGQNVLSATHGFP